MAKHGRADHLKERGSAIIIVLIALMIVTSAFVVFSDMIIRERVQVLKTTSVLNLRFALNSVLDYMLFGIRQRWCFSKQLMADSNCDLRHPASTMRIAMSNDEENYIRSLIQNGIDVGPYQDIDHLSLDSFEIKMNIDDLSALHPLFPILQAVKSDTIKGLYIKVTRDRSVYLPKTGGEAFLDIVVELVDNNGKHPVAAGGGVLSLTSRVSMHPRELGSFALVIAKNLYLDRHANEPPPSKGDVIIGNGGYSSSNGLIFLSPVFVNENIYLPTVNYTPVTFADRVYIGNGRIYKGVKAFSPETAGGPGSRLWSELNSRFGGFLNGFEIDGKIDKGLVHAFQAPNSWSMPGNLTLMQRCVIHTQYLADQSKLANNLLSARRKGFISANEFIYSVGYENTKRQHENPPQSDEFMSQKISNLIDTTGWRTNSSSLARDDNKNTSNRILNFTLQIGKNTLKAHLGRGSVLRITPDYLPDINSKIASLEKQLNQGGGPGGGGQGGGGQGGGGQGGGGQGGGGQGGGGQGGGGQGGGGQSGGGQGGGGQGGGGQGGGGQGGGGQGGGGQGGGGQGGGGQGGGGQGGGGQGGGGQGGGGQNSPLQQELNAWRALRNAYRAPQIIISVEPVLYGGIEQPHVVDVRMRFENAEFLLNEKLERQAPVMIFGGYDPTYVRGQPISANTNGLNHKKRYLNFSFTTTSGSQTIVAPIGFADSPNGMATEAPPDAFAFNWGQFNKECEELRGAKEGQAFGAAAWDYDFSPKARESWNFAGEDGVTHGDPILPEIVFDNLNARPNNVSFQIRSIVGVCRIRSTAEIVTGFLTCDRLVIEPRSKPLRIIGTFIVGALQIDPSALAAGIRWSSIYYPEATFELRKVGILKSATGAPCSETPDPNNPIWHPVPSIQAVASRFSCNAISLRAKADPFQWTAVNPDCGRLPGASATSCKRHPENYFVIEYSREGGI